MPATTPLINGKTNWELNLDKQKEEVEKADRELWPNRFNLRARYNAQRQSYLSTMIEQEKQKLDIERRAYLIRPSGLFVPVNPEEVRRSQVESTARQQIVDSVIRHNGVPYMPSPRDNEPGGRYYRERPELAAPRPYRYQQPKSDDVEYSMPGDEQKFIQRIGMMSSCNVNMQSKPVGGRTEFGSIHTGFKTYRMMCEQCRATEQIDRTIVEKFDASHPQIKNFCDIHRHDPEASLSNGVEGRKFRG